MLMHLKLPRLVDPFRRSLVNGRLLAYVESVDDLVDIDDEVNPIFARVLFSNLTAWKSNGGRVPRKLLSPMSDDSLRIDAISIETSTV